MIGAAGNHICARPNLHEQHWLAADHGFRKCSLYLRVYIAEQDFEMRRELRSVGLTVVLRVSADG